MNKENSRIIFYGFAVGTVLLHMSIPSFFFWRDVTDHVETIFKYVGFVLFAVCGVAIILQVIRAFFGK